MSIEIAPLAAPPVEPAAAPVVDPPAAPPVEPAPPASERPEWFPEKYYTDGGPGDLEKLGRSYTALQTAFSSKNPHLAEVPENPDGYAFKPEKLPDGVTWSDEAAKFMGEAFHKAQIGNTQAKAVAEAFMEMEAKNTADAMAVYEAQQAADKKALAEKWGGEEKFTAKAAEISEYVESKLGKDPADVTLFSSPRMLEFLSEEVAYVKALEAQLGEDALAKAKGSVGPGPSITNSATEAQRIMNDPTHPQNAAYRAGDPDVVQRVVTMLSSK